MGIAKSKLGLDFTNLAVPLANELPILFFCYKVKVEMYCVGGSCDHSLGLIEIGFMLVGC